MISRKVLLCLALGVLLVALPMAAFATFSGVKICLDPGHGGSDPGAVGNGLEEADINLDIALRARGLFQQDAASVVMTRTTDTYVSLQGRCDVANNNGASRFICSHCNAGGGTGTETFCYSAVDSTTYDLRNKINPEMVSHMGTVNRGLKTADFYVLIHTNMPAILCEVAFIDTAADAAKLGSPTYRQEAARAYLHGTQAHYGMSPHDPGAAEVIVDNSSSAFSASASWTTGTSAPDKYGSDYRWRSTTAISDPAKWQPALSSGNYAVYAWWAAGTNRSAAAPYKVNYNGGSATVNANQQANGGKWNYLGTWNFVNGNNVQLSCWAPTGFIVVADAVKFVPN